jgi:hypothetical protein
VRLLVVLVVTVALLVAAAPIALTQAPRLHSPLLAVVAFGVAVIALIAGVALLARATMLHRRTGPFGPRALEPAGAGPRREAVRARVVPAPRSGDDQPPGDDADTEPRPGPDRIVLVPSAGRITVSTGASVTGPRHALIDEAVTTPRQARQDPSTAGQSPTDPSHTHAQQISGLDDPADPNVEEDTAARSAAFAARYTATRSRR